MNKETVIKVTNATVRFNKATENYNGLKEYVIKMFIKQTVIFNSSASYNRYISRVKYFFYYEAHNIADIR